MDNRFVVLITIEGNLIFGFDPGQRKDIGNAIWMEPHCAISWELTYHVGSGHPSCTMDVHILVDLPDIFEELAIDKYINGGLVVQ